MYVHNLPWLVFHYVPLETNDTNFLGLNMSWGWNLAQDDAYVWNLIQETYQLVDALTKQRGLWDPYIFLNDAYPSQKVLQS